MSLYIFYCRVFVVVETSAYTINMIHFSFAFLISLNFTEAKLANTEWGE